MSRVRGCNRRIGGERCNGRRLRIEHGGAVDRLAVGEEWKERPAKFAAAGPAAAQQRERERGSECDGEGERGEQGRGHGDGQRAEEAAGDTRGCDERKEDNHGSDGGEDERRGEFVQRNANGGCARLSRVAMHDDVLHHHDGVVDDQTDGGGEAAEGHQIEGLSDGPEKENRNRYGYRNDEAGDQRAGPVAQKEEENHAGQHKPDEDGVAHAGDGLAHQFGLVVKGGEMDPGGQGAAELRDLGGDAIGHGDGVGGGLAGDVEQDGGDAVGGDGVVDGLGAGMYVGHIGDAHGSAAGSGFDDQRGEVGDVVRLRTDQRENSSWLAW